jgi:hypothetical protein
LSSIGAHDGGIGVKEDAVADIDGEILRRAGGRRARAAICAEAEITGIVRQIVFLRGAACDGKREKQGDHCGIAGNRG